MTTRGAVIAGGGIGGLTAALCLAEQGWDVRVLEQASAFGPVGAGIQISPNATRVLYSLGLEEALKRHAFLPDGIEIRSYRRGHILGQAELGESTRAQFGFPSLHIHRADLHEVLAEAANDHPRVEIELSCGVTEIRSEPERETAITSDGRTYEASLVVGADGIKSAVRESLFGPEAPRFTGCVAYRGLVPAKLLRDADVRPVATNWLGPKRHFVHYYLRRGDLVNFVACVEEDGWEIESWTEPAEKAELKTRFAGWHPTVQAIINASDTESLFRWAIFDRDPMQAWSRGATTLLGDACHPMPPFMAQGGCMAIEDAAVLVGCLERDADIAHALPRYEALRRPRTARIQEGSRANMDLYHMSGPRALARNVAMRVAGQSLARRAAALYTYDALHAAHNSPDPSPGPVT